MSKHLLEKRRRTLIVCEGMVDRLYLLTVIKRHTAIAKRPLYPLRNVSANGRDNVLRTVHNQLKTSEDPYASVYVVLDTENRDDIQQIEKRFENIIRQAGSRAPKDYRIFWSHPSIERWFLLHFEGSNAAFSQAQAAIQKLRQHYPDYSKDTKSIGRFLSFLYPAPCFEACLRCALERAQRLEAAAQAIGDPPPTQIHRLIQAIFPAVQPVAGEDCRKVCRDRRC